MFSSEISAVLHWWPPDVHIFYTYPSLISTALTICHDTEHQNIAEHIWLKSLNWVVLKLQATYLLANCQNSKYSFRCKGTDLINCHETEHQR